jgi:hypothetical protein
VAYLAGIKTEKRNKKVKEMKTTIFIIGIIAWCFIYLYFLPLILLMAFAILLLPFADIYP